MKVKILTAYFYPREIFGSFKKLKLLEKFMKKNLISYHIKEDEVTDPKEYSI